MLCKSTDWFLYYRDLHHERLKDNFVRHPKKLELANALKKIWKSKKRRLQDIGIEDNSDGEQENNTDPIGNTKQGLSKIEYQFAYIIGIGALLQTQL